MTRFAYIADTHFGAESMRYQQQQGYPKKLPEILSALVESLSASGGIDFILHGGDMIDRPTEDNIAAAAAAFDLEVPVYLCLGNHDQRTPDDTEKWLELAPQFFIDHSPNFTIATDHCAIHVAPNLWREPSSSRKGKLDAYLSADQTETLARALRSPSNIPHFIQTHSPVFGLPVEQTGLSEPYACPDTRFTKQISEFVEGRENLKCVLGAHTHLNMRATFDGIEFATVSSLVETPFEYKLFEIAAERIEMSTISLEPMLSFAGKYDTSRSFAQGRPIDRSFKRAWSR